MKELVEKLCSDACAGRAAGSPGGARARSIVFEALASAGLEPIEQHVPAFGGANVLASLRGDTDRWVIVAAHYDHLGRHGRQTFHGADDNAAAVAILVEVASALVHRRQAGRGVLFAAFDGEEPPHFLSEAMGSEHFVRHPTVELDHVDLMICMDLVGHAVGPEGMPDAVRQSLFALGAERSEGTAALVDSIVEPGVFVRRVDAEVIPPLSDYWPFWRRGVPFLFLTCGRWRHYHTPEDTPEKLDWDKMAATAGWLERFVRAACQRPERRVAFTGEPDDASTLESLLAITTALEPHSPMARAGSERIRALQHRLHHRRLEPSDREQAQQLVGLLESALA